MFLTTVEAAMQLGISERQMRRLVAGGRVSTEKYGRAYLIPAKQVQSMRRATNRGRDWLTVTQDAALDLLLSGDTTRVTGSEKSRLRGRVRTMSVQALAHQVLRNRAELRRETSEVHRNARKLSVASELGLSERGGLAVFVSENAKQEVRRQRLVVDNDGDVVVIEGESHHQAALEVLALFVYGSAREHTAAARWLADRQGRL